MIENWFSFFLEKTTGLSERPNKICNLAIAVFIKLNHLERSLSRKFWSQADVHRCSFGSRLLWNASGFDEESRTGGELTGLIVEWHRGARLFLRIRPRNGVDNPGNAPRATPQDDPQYPVESGKLVSRSVCLDSGRPVRLYRCDREELGKSRTSNVDAENRLSRLIGSSREARGARCDSLVSRRAPAISRTQAN